MKVELNDNAMFKKSVYREPVFHQIHDDIIDDVFNNLIIDFIDSDILKSLFVCNAIQYYIKGK